MGNKKIKQPKKIEFEEVLLDKISEEQKQEESLMFEKKIETPLTKQRAFFLFGILFFIIAILLSRTLFFQVIQHQRFSLLAEQNKSKIYLIRPLRGIIYDKDFNQLVVNQPVFDLIYETDPSPFFKKEKEKEIFEMAEILKEKLIEKIENSQTENVLIYQNIEQDKLIEIMSKLDRFPRFKIEETIVRNYLEGLKTSHLIGYTNKITSKEFSLLEDYDISDIIGRGGVEQIYETFLRGKPGKLKVERDALGREIKKGLIQEPEQGKNLVLHLDIQFQRKAFEILEKNLEKFGINKGAVVALNPNNGGVIALVSHPSFNNNLFGYEVNYKELEALFKSPDGPFLNRAISGLYPLGSTIKPFTAVAGLEEEIIVPEKRISCPGSISIFNPWTGGFSVFSDWEVHGIVDLKKAIAKSCNVYFYTLGGGYKEVQGLGVERINKYLKSFNFGQITNIDLPNERPGFIPSPEWKREALKDSWRIGDTYNLSIGQGYIQSTPIQLAIATSALINGGKIIKPQVVDKIVDSERNLIIDVSPEILYELPYDQKNFNIVQEGMREAVNSGTAFLLSYLPVKSAAKTGTAQTSKEKTYHYWITVFAPYENPDLVLVVLIEELKGATHLATIVAKEILEWHFSRQY